MSELYAIRRKSDHRLMPNTGRNHTWTEFEAYGEPRLFLKASSAKKALRAWSQGQWRRTYDDGLPEPGPVYGRDACGYIDHKNPVIRNYDDYEIVSVQLLVRSLS